jgi:hypothetical protein
MLSISYDETTGIACTTSNGLASVEEFNAYFPLAIEYLNRSRARHGGSLHLVDVADNPVQAKDSFAHMALLTQDEAKAGDQCAIIIHSTLARMQIKRMADGFDRQFFAEKAAAIDWLLNRAVKGA